MECVRATDFSWKAAGLEILAVTASSRNWMCFSGAVCGQRMVLFLRSSQSLRCSQQPCDFMCCCSFLPAEKSSAGGEAVTFHRKCQYGGGSAHTNFIQGHAETFVMTHVSAVMGHCSECPAGQSCAWLKMPACPRVYPTTIMA